MKNRTENRALRILAKGVVAVLVGAFMALCIGCGGGESASNGQQFLRVQPVPLRPCETTGPTAPPCTASQAAGAH